MHVEYRGLNNRSQTSEKLPYRRIAVMMLTSNCRTQLALGYLNLNIMHSTHRVLLAAVVLAVCLSVPAFAKKKKDAAITNKVITVAGCSDTVSLDHQNCN